MATLIAELVGFLVILLVLYRYVWPPVSRMMGERQDTIQQQVQDSEDAARRLEAAEQRFQTAVAQARNEAARIRDDARVDAQQIRDELQEQADREVERIRQRGEEQLATQRELTVRQLRSEIGGLSLQLAERIILESLSDDERRRSTVDGVLDELDHMPGRGADDGAGHRDGAGNREAAAAGGTT